MIVSFFVYLIFLIIFIWNLPSFKDRNYTCFWYMHFLRNIPYTYHCVGGPVCGRVNRDFEHGCLIFAQIIATFRSIDRSAARGKYWLPRMNSGSRSRMRHVRSSPNCSRSSRFDTASCFVFRLSLCTFFTIPLVRQRSTEIRISERERERRKRSLIFWFCDFVTFNRYSKRDSSIWRSTLRILNLSMYKIGSVVLQQCLALTID